MRDYRAEDGLACHALRRRAFLDDFSQSLPQDAVQAGADSYGVSEFAKRIGAMETSVATVDDVVAGFCSIRLLSPTRAEVLYLYVDSEHRRSGIGARLARHAEQRVSSAHPELETLFLDTAIPEYNQAFWERIGYQLVGPSSCDYPTGRIPAVRLEKRVDRQGSASAKASDGGLWSWTKD
jgi:ribosomal protein S18 acetylase RimI-like enzyme